MKKHKLVRLSCGEVDTELHQITFDVRVAGAEEPISFVSDYGPISHLLAGLGRMFLELQSALLEQKGMQQTLALKVGSANVERERWQNEVIIELTTPEGIPYTFSMPPDEAVRLGEMLKLKGSIPNIRPGVA